MRSIWLQRIKHCRAGGQQDRSRTVPGRCEIRLLKPFRGQYDAPAPAENPPPSGPWGNPPSDKPKPEPRLRESQPAPTSSPVPKTPARHSDTIGTTIVKSAARTATNIAVREASKAIFGSGRNSGILGQIVRGTLGGLVK